jgi:hypothetical protein
MIRNFAGMVFCFGFSMLCGMVAIIEKLEGYQVKGMMIIAFILLCIAGWYARDY